MEKAQRGIVMEIRNEVLRVIDDCPKKLLILKSDVQEQVIKLLGDRWDYFGGYQAFAAAIHALELERLIKPVKNHGLNGLNPPLFLRYRKILSQQHDYEETKKEILSIYRSQIDLTHFLTFPQEYADVRNMLLAIDHFLLESRDKPPRVWDTVNERSFMLTGNEKFLASTAGKRLLKLIGIDLPQLYCVPTPEPFFYWATGIPSSTPNCADCLIVENKDTFYTFKKLIASQSFTLSPPVQLLIYGEGKKILSSWPFIFECLPSFKIRFFYFGDLDPEGVAICADLIRSTTASENNMATIETIPAESLYALLLEAGRTRVLNRDQSRVADERMKTFFQHFRPEFKNRVSALWQEGLVIPQEAVPASFLAAKGGIEL
jgi:hypothetical protein